jgi:hypothetical protein
VMAESDVDARNKKVGVLANAKRTGGFRVISDPVVDDPTWDNDTNAPLFAIRRWRRSMSDLEYQDATEFAPPAPGKVNAQLGDNVRGIVWLDGKTPLPVVLLRGHDEQGAGFGRKHIVAKQDRFGTGAEMFQKLEDLLANSYVKDAKEYSTTKYVPPRGDANPNDLDYQTRWTDPSDQQVYVLGLEKFDKGGVKYAAITTFYPTRAKAGERTGRGATESDIAAYRRMRDQKFSIAPETEYMAMSSYAKVKELKKLQILNIFGGKRATEQLRSIADEKSRSTMVFMTPDEYRLMTPQNLRLGPDQVKAYANNIDRGMTLNEIPRLGIRGGLDGTIAEVYEHEGRHRSKALQMLGFEYIPVIISHETYRWGERYPSDAVQPTQLRTQTGTTVIQLPESVIFPEGALTPRFKDVVEQDKSDKQIRFFAGLAYDQDDMNASVVRLKEQLSFLARQNFDTSGGLRQRVIRELSQPMVAAAAAHGARVTNSAAQGMYGGVAELSVGFDATFPNTGMAGINNTAAEIMLAAKRSNQTDAFAAVEVPLDYIGENVRPGVTIHFYPKPGGAATSRTLEEVGAFIAQLQTDNIQGYTAFQSNSATSDETGYEGIRFVWVPEYTGVAEADVEKNRIDVVNELDEIVQRAYDLEIGSAKAANYIAALGQKGTYDATAEALSNPDVGANDVGPIGEHGPWRRSVRSSVAERSGRGKGTPGDGTSTVHDNDGVPRGPQYSINAQRLLRDNPASLGLNPTMAARVNPIYRTNILPAAPMPTNQEAALWLERQFGGEVIDDMTAVLTPAQLREVATLMAAEVQLGLQSTGSAFDWYSGALDRTLDVVKVKYPMLADDNAAAAAGFGSAANARFVFTYILAVTSQNLKVSANANATDKAFTEMLPRVMAGQYGMLGSWATGDKQKAMAKNFDKFTDMLNGAPGNTFPDKLTELNRLFKESRTVKDWVKEFKRLGIPYSAPGQTAANAVVYGSSMLGPKIGNGFWQNLNGNFNPLTIDLWMRRTWGRLTGKSIGNPGALAGQRDRFKRAVVRSRSQKQGKADHIEAADDAVDLWELRLRQVRALTADAFASKKAFDIEEKYLKAKLADAVEIAADMRGIKLPEPWRPEYNTDQGALLAYAKRALAVWNKEYKILAAHYKLPENSNGQGVPPELQPTWARAAKTIVTNLAKPLDQVANGTQRIQIEAAGAMALDILAERGINMTMADMQAVMWYPEKELWGALTTELDVDEDGDPIVPPSSLNESYDTVFANILGSQGYEVQGTEGNRSGGTGAGAVAGQDDRYVGPESTRGDAPVYAGTDGQAGSVGSEKFSIAPAINTPAFKKWFGDSKVVDAAGKPLVVYHGTASDFEAFDPQFNKVGVQGGGFYFTTRKPLAEDYAYGANRDQEGRLIEAYISLKNPVIKMPGIPLSTEEIAAIRSDFTEGGYDGFIEYLPSGGINTVIATDPTQIKSVNNRGTFDPNDDRISYAVNPSRLDPRGRAYMDMFSENNKSLRDRIARELKRQFSPGGLLPAIVFELKLSRDAKFNVQDDITARTLAAVSRAAKAGYGKRFVNLTQAEKKGIQDALSGVVPLSTLPSQMQAAVVMMRQSLDANSGELIKIIEADIAELLASGDPTAAAKAQMLRDIIESNKGSWVTRSYKVFDDPLWFKKIPQDVLDTAYEYLLRQSNGDHARTQRVFDELTKGEKTAYSGMEALIKESKLGAKDLSILMARKNIAPEIRALMGEYQNPMHNYARSMLKMTRLIWNTHFLKDVLKNGEGVFLFKDGTQPPGFTEMIAGVNSKTLSPLNGMRTTPEIAQAFKDALGKSSMGNVMSTLIGINGIVKAGKILYSPPTQIRNLASASFFGIASGGVHLKEAIPAANIVWQQIIAKEGSAAKAYRYYVDIGLTHDTPNAGMVQDLMNDGDHMLRAIEYHMQDKFGVNAVEPMISGGKKVHEVISNLYRGGDDVWKIIIFESALTDYMKATGMTRTQAERIVAKRVRDTVPTYSLTGKAIKELGRFPLIGPFVAFSSEIIRTTINSVKLIKSDMADPRLRGLAMKRIVGMTIAHSWAFAAMAASKIANGLDDDDEEAIRKIGTGPWGTNSDYLFTGRNDKGQLTYVDLSFLDPYNMFHKAVTSMLRNQPWEAKLAGAAAEIYMPFVQPDIAFSGIYEVVTNSRMRSGAPIYNPDAPVGDQTMDIASHLFFQLAPGVVNPIRKVAKAMKGDLDPSGRVYDLTNEAAGMFGLRINTFDPKSSLYWRVGDFNEAMSNSRKYLGDIARDLNPRSEEELADAFKTANSMRLRAYDDMMQMVNAAKNSGLSDQAVRKVLRLSNVSKTYANALALGRPAPDWRIEKSFLRGASKRAAFLIDQEKANELRERRNFIRDTARAARSTE